MSNQPNPNAIRDVTITHIVEGRLRFRHIKGDSLNLAVELARMEFHKLAITRACLAFNHGENYRNPTFSTTLES